MSSTKALTKKSYKLDSDEMRKVVAWFGMCKTAPEVQCMIKTRFKKDLTLDAVKQIKYRDGNRAIIQRHRDEYNRDIFLVELANKRRRLEKIEDIIEKAEQSGNLKIALDGLGQIKQEVEKDLSSLNMTNYNINVYKNMTEAEIEEEKVKSLERIKILKGAIQEAKQIAGTVINKHAGGDYAVREEETET